MTGSVGLAVLLSEGDAGEFSALMCSKLVELERSSREGGAVDALTSAE